MFKSGLKVNESKKKVMVLGGEERLECDVCVGGIRLEHVSEFKYLGCNLDKSGSNEAECRRKVVRGMRVVGANRSLVNFRGLQLECAMDLHESFFVPVLMYDKEGQGEV